jgi:hypothetical protein
LASWVNCIMGEGNCIPFPPFLRQKRKEMAMPICRYEHNGFEIEIEHDNDYYDDPNNWGSEVQIATFSEYQIETNEITRGEADDILTAQTSEDTDYYYFAITGATRWQPKIHAYTLPAANDWLGDFEEDGFCGGGYSGVGRVAKSIAQNYQEAEQIIDSQCKIFNYLFDGECYFFRILDSEGNIVDLCGGFIGELDYCLSAARAVIDAQ